MRVDQEASPFLPEVIDVISRSECGTTSTAPDPLLDWVYDGPTEGACAPLSTEPSPHRQAWFRWLTTYLVYFGINRQSLYALVDKESRKVVAAAVVGPPRTVAFDRSGDEMGRNIHKAGVGMAIEVLVENLRMRSLGTWQHKHLPASGSNFLYISIFATAPEWQGRGCGSALLQFLGEVADADGVVSFLETAGVRNATFYAEKGGYEVVAREPLASFKHDGGAVSMRRLPGAVPQQRPPRQVKNSGRNVKQHSARSRHALEGPAATKQQLPACGNVQTHSKNRHGKNDSAHSRSAAEDGALSKQQPAAQGSRNQGSCKRTGPAARELALARELAQAVDATSPAANSKQRQADHMFCPKSRTGPLASYCRLCNAHRSKHGGP